jgi:hypothetical protein
VRNTFVLHTPTEACAKVPYFWVYPSYTEFCELESGGVSSRAMASAFVTKIYCGSHGTTMRANEIELAHLNFVVIEWERHLKNRKLGHKALLFMPIDHKY